MGKDSFVFYKSFYEAIKNIPQGEQLKVYTAIFENEFNDVEIELDGIAKAIYILMKPNIEASNARYIASVENGKKGGRPKNKTQEKPNNNLSQTQKKPNTNLNVNDNDNLNVNDNVDVVVKSDGCVDGFLQSDSCVDEIVKFYEENIGMITPHEFEVLDGYRTDFDDEVIIYALKLQVEKRVNGVSYAKAILNSWKKKNIKTLVEAQNENRKIFTEKPVTNNTYHDENNQYSNLDRFYMN